MAFFTNIYEHVQRNLITVAKNPHTNGRYARPVLDSDQTGHCIFCFFFFFTFDVCLFFFFVFLRNNAGFYSFGFYVFCYNRVKNKHRDISIHCILILTFYSHRMIFSKRCGFYGFFFFYSFLKYSRFFFVLYLFCEIKLISYQYTFPRKLFSYKYKSIEN